MKIIPSIPTESTEELIDLIEMAEGVVDRVSVDIVDGEFADRKTVKPNVLSDFTTSVNLDFQLMVDEPFDWIDQCVAAGADRIIGHVEMMNDQRDFVRKVKDVNMLVGLGIDIDTPVDEIDEMVISKLDVVLLMSVPAGFGGQKFDDSVIDKIKELNRTRQLGELKFKIHVDGGVTSELVGRLEKLGVDEVSVGKRIFDGKLKKNLEKFNHGG